MLTLPRSDSCATRYPIVLVHGAGFRDDNPLYGYWGRIPAALRAAGATVCFGRQDAWGTVEDNAADLAATVDAVLAASGAPKVNLIAHSKGGLECRYLISSLGLAAKVASLSTVATPHWGSRTLDAVCAAPAWLYRALAFVVDLACRALGDRHPDFYAASRQLTRGACRRFNRANPDAPGVRYQSWAGAMRYPWSDPLFWFSWSVVRAVEGPNDGLVAVRSARWGDFRGVARGRTWRGVSHSDLIDLYRSRSRSFDIVGLYLSMAAGLKEAGL